MIILSCLIFACMPEFPVPKGEGGYFVSWSLCPIVNVGGGALARNPVEVCQGRMTERPTVRQHTSS